MENRTSGVAYRAGIWRQRAPLPALAGVALATVLILMGVATPAGQHNLAEAAGQRQEPPPTDMIPLTAEDIRFLAAKPWLDETPQTPVPEQLQGLILFRSDLAIEDPFEARQCRSYPELCDVYAIDPATGSVWMLADPWPHTCAEERDAFSSNRHYRALVQEGWIEFSSAYGPINSLQFQIKYYDSQFKVIRSLSHFGARFFGSGFAPFGDSWDPVWSPTSDVIAFVSNETGNDDIYVVTKDRWPPRQLTRNEWAGDKHPSWSPDGKQIVFESNRDGQHRLWIMDADGSNQRPLTDPVMSAQTPVWVKYVGSDGCP